jgi:hypothetical protein
VKKIEEETSQPDVGEWEEQTAKQYLDPGVSGVIAELVAKR